jgi:DHA1 family inner membrane transport protein
MTSPSAWPWTARTPPCATHSTTTVVLVALLGFFGLGANPVLMALAVRYAGKAPTLASALTVSAFNLGTAIGSAIAGQALDSGMGSTGPAVAGTAIAALTLIPTTVLALNRHRRPAVSGPGALPSAPAHRSDQA